MSGNFSFKQKIRLFHNKRSEDVAARFEDVCEHEVQQRCFGMHHSDGHDGVIYIDLLKLCETCQSGANNVSEWRQRARHNDIMDFGADLLDFITEECSKVIIKKLSQIAFHGTFPDISDTEG